MLQLLPPNDDYLVFNSGMYENSVVTHADCYFKSEKKTGEALTGLAILFLWFEEIFFSKNKKGYSRKMRY